MKNLFRILFAIFGIGTDVMSATKLVEARAMLPENIQKEIEGTVRKSDLIRGFLADANESQAKVQSDFQYGRTMKVSMLLGETITAGNAASCTPTGNRVSSATVTISPFAATGIKTLSKTQLNVNDFAFMQVLQRALLDIERGIFFGGANSVNSKILAGLVANKSTVNSGDTYGATLNAGLMEVAAENIDAFYSLLASHMSLNDLDGGFKLYSNTHWKYTFNKASKITPMTNAVDVATDNGIEQFFSNDIAPATGYSSNHYLVKNGAMGLVTLEDSLYKNFDPNWKAAYARYTYDSMLFPGVKIMLSEHHACADTSATGGQVKDDVIHLEGMVIGGVYHVPSTLKRVYNYATLPAGILEEV